MTHFTEHSPKDYEFSSPSAAAAVILGYPVNGRDYWKVGAKTLNQFEEELAKNEADKQGLTDDETES